MPHGASAVAALNSLRKGTHDEDKANVLFEKIAGLSVRLGFTIWVFYSEGRRDRENSQ